MTETLHILRKDLGRMRWWLVAWVMLVGTRAVLTAATAPTAIESLAGQILLDQSMRLLGLLNLVMLALLVARLVHDEPLVGLDWWWLTRPYDRRALATEKLLVAAVFFVALPIAADLLVMRAFGAETGDMARAASVSLAREAQLTLGLMAIAVLTPSLVVYAISLVGVVAALVLLMMMAVTVALLTFDEHAPQVAPDAPDPTTALVAVVVFVAAALMVILYQYQQRRLARAIALAMAGLAAVAIVPAVWPWSFVRTPATTLEAPSGDLEQVVATIDPGAAPEVFDAPDLLRRRGGRRRVGVPVSLTGLPPAYRVRDLTTRATLEFPDGQALQSAQGGAMVSAFGGSSHDDTGPLQAALGDVRLANIEDASTSGLATLLTISADELDRYGSLAGRLVATLDYALLRSRALGALPLADGAELDGSAMRIQILRVQRRQDGCTLVIRQWRATSMLSAPEYVHHDFVLRNAGRGEAFTGARTEPMLHGAQGLSSLFPFGFLVGQSQMAGFAVSYIVLDYPMRLPGQMTRQTMDPEWLAEADVAIIETAYASRLTRNVTVEDFRMARR